VGAGVAIWFHPEVVLRPQWLAGAPTDSVGGLADHSAVDRWGRERTAGLIDRLSVGVRRDALVVLAMALALRTRWRQPFTASGLWPAAGPRGCRVVHSAR